MYFWSRCCVESDDATFAKLESRALCALTSIVTYPDGRLVLGHASQAEDASLERKRRIRELEGALLPQTPSGGCSLRAYQS